MPPRRPTWWTRLFGWRHASAAAVPVRVIQGPTLAQLVDEIELLVRTRLWLQILVAMGAGIGVGLLLSPSGGAVVSEDTADTVAEWLSLPGQVFLAVIQMMMIPLVVSSIVVGITSSGDPDFLRRAGLRVAPYFIGTTTVAVTIGLVLALSLDPGSSIDPVAISEAIETGDALAVAPAMTESLPERIIGLIPSDPLAAALDRAMLQIVIFAILMAVALLAIPRQRSQLLIELGASVQEISIKVVSWAMLIAPLAVFGLLARIMVDVGLDAITGMLEYVGVVLAGLGALLVVYLVLVWSFAGVHPGTFMRAARETQLLAFSTSSSAAALPVTLRTAEEKLGVAPSVARFVIPVGATINMDGTALYQAVAAVFLTQVFGVDLSLEDLVLLTATTVGASIGSPSAPGVGIVILATILSGVGVPPAGIALIIGVDRLLDMCRTTVNVTGDLAACLIVQRWLGFAPTPPVEAAAGADA